MIENELKTQSIVFYTPGLYPCKTGGMEIYNYNIIKYLSNKNISIVALTACNILYDKYQKYYPINNKIFLTSRYGLGVLSTFIYYIFYKKIRLGKDTIFVIPYTSNFTYNVVPFLIFSKILNFRYVVHIHGGGIKKWRMAWLQRFFFKKAHKIAGVSQTIVDEYSQRCKRKIEHLPPIIPFIENKQEINELKGELDLKCFDKIILFVGSLKPLKAPDILIEAFILFNFDFIRRNKIGLVLAGDGPLKNDLKNRIKQSEHEPYVRMVGMIPYESIYKYYSISDIFVLPSWFEGTSIALLEAMYNKLCCICSDVPGNRNVITNYKNGYLFEKGNYNRLKDLLETCLANDPERKTMGRKAYSYYMKYYSFEQHIHRFMKFITK